MSADSPIARLIDAACSKPTPHYLAQQAAQEVIGHIDTMYPAMWDGVPKSARTSVKNTVYQQVMMAMKKNQP